MIHVHFYTSESKPGLATPKNKRTLVQKSLQRPFFVSYNQHQPSILYSFLKLDVLDREANFRGSIKPEKCKKLEPAFVILSGTEVGWDKLWLSKVFSYYVGPHVLGKRAWRAQFWYRDTLIIRDRLSWWIFALEMPLNMLEHQYTRLADKQIGMELHDTERLAKSRGKKLQTYDWNKVFSATNSQYRQGCSTITRINSIVSRNVQET